MEANIFSLRIVLSNREGVAVEFYSLILPSHFYGNKEKGSKEDRKEGCEEGSKEDCKEGCEEGS